MEQTTTRTTGQETQAPHPQQQWPTAPPPPARATGIDRERFTRTWLVVLMLVLLSISLFSALIAANEAIYIWLRPQYAPLVQLVGALVVAVVSLLVVFRLTKRN